MASRILGVIREPSLKRVLEIVFKGSSYQIEFLSQENISADLEDFWDVDLLIVDSYNQAIENILLFLKKIYPI